MKMAQSFQLAIKSILSNKMRSMLTMLGMIIGVGSVIIILGIMNGVKSNIAGEFSDYGTNTITINVQQHGNRRVEEADMFQLVSDHKDLFVGVSPTVDGTMKVTGNGKTIKQQTMHGVAENYFTINNADLEAGRNISYADVSFRQNNCVLGSKVADKLFGTSNPVGKNVKITGQDFTVIGVRKETADNQAYTADDGVYLAYNKLGRMTTGYTGVSAYVFAVKQQSQVDEGKTVIEEKLKEILGSSEYYYMNDMASMLKMFNSMMTTLSLAISGIAAISLLVAGIGVMNIMLVMVTERTKEIGIRKSLGARKKDILGQFLMEAGVVSGLGGVIGIIFGIGVIYAVRSLSTIKAAPTLGAVIISFSISVGVGILFGYMPAKKAANMNPIDALRSE